MSEAVYVGIGSNLNDPKQQVLTAAAELAELASADFLLSPLYGSRAVGPGKQPDYVNAVAKFKTKIEPQALLAKLQLIEKKHRRKRGVRWQARTLDLDLLLYAERIISTPELLLPHPRMCERSFVLRPMLDLDPEVTIPGRFESLVDLAAQLDLDTVWRLNTH